MIFDASACEEKIGYVFKDKALLRRCFTHTSYANEHGQESYEKLEFLGDSILNFIVAEHLFNTSKGDEGDMTKRRAELVSTKPIGEVIQGLDLGKEILLGEGEKNKPLKINMCADIFESVVAGIYIDGGLENAKKFICTHLLKEVKKTKSVGDCKSALQEYVQKYKKGVVEYALREKKGPDHAPTFTCKASVGKIFAMGTGQSKRQAEQSAAQSVLKKLKNKRGK